MPQGVPFVRVLALLEERGWEFTGIWTPYRVFKKPGRLPILVEVQGKVVTHEDFENIRATLERDADEPEAGGGEDDE